MPEVVAGVVTTCIQGGGMHRSKTFVAVTGVAVLGGMLGLASPSSAAPSPASLPAKVGVLTWNICGAIAACPSVNQPQSKISELVNRVLEDDSIAVIMIQETCASIHSRPLERSLEAATGGGWVVRHRTAKTPGTAVPVVCPKTGLPEAGTAVAMKELPDSDIVGFDMTFTSTDEERTGQIHTQGAACLQDEVNRLMACTSHFANSSADPLGALRRASVRDFRQQALDKQNGGYRTIIGGDLNLPDDDPDIQPMYDGNFEADSDDKCPTTGPGVCTPIKFGDKIDYIFFSDRGWDLDSGDASYTSNTDIAYDSGNLSDHWILEGVVTPA